MLRLTHKFRSLFAFSATKYPFARDISGTVQRKHMNLFEAVNSAIDIALEKDETYLK